MVHFASSPKHGALEATGRIHTWMARVLILGVAAAALGIHVPRLAAQSEPSNARIVALGGSVTETVFALGAGPLVVAVDESSVFPAEVQRLPQVGYYRTLSTEGVLSLRPSLVIASEDAGPDVVLRQVEAAGVRVVRVPEGYDRESALTKIRVVADALGKSAEGAHLVTRLEATLREAERAKSASLRHPRALFVWSRGSGGLVVGGNDTAAGALLTMAGAANASMGVRGYQPMNAEAIVAAAPEVLIVPSSTLEGFNGLDALLALPGISATPAARARRVVTVDLLGALGFGPRLGDEVLRLAQLLQAASGGDR